jgi:seryl-tRNA synthetase
MLDIKFIRDNADLIKKNAKDRLSTVDIDKLIELDKKKRELELKIDTLRAKRNTASKTKPTPEEIVKMKEVGNEIQKLEKELAPTEEKFHEILMQVPNLTHPDVKISQNEDDNVVLEKGEPTKFDFEPLDHVQLAEKLDLIDFERGTKVTGAKFYYFKNEVALLELALTHYAFDVAIKHGFTPL